MIGQTAIAIPLSGFNEFGRSVAHIFLLIHHFPYRFSSLSEKKKMKNVNAKNPGDNATAIQNQTSFAHALSTRQSP